MKVCVQSNVRIPEKNAPLMRSISGHGTGQGSGGHTSPRTQRSVRTAARITSPNTGYISTISPIKALDRSRTRMLYHCARTATPSGTSRTARNPGGSQKNGQGSKQTKPLPRCSWHQQTSRSRNMSRLQQQGERRSTLDANLHTCQNQDPVKLTLARASQIGMVTQHGRDVAPCLAVHRLRVGNKPHVNPVGVVYQSARTARRKRLRLPAAASFALASLFNAEVSDNQQLKRRIALVVGDTMWLIPPLAKPVKTFSENGKSCLAIPKKTGITSIKYEKELGAIIGKESIKNTFLPALTLPLSNDRIGE